MKCGTTVALALGLLAWSLALPAQTDATSEPSASPEAEEEEKILTFGADLDLVSKYIWRGLNLNDSLSFQPNLWGSAYGLTVSLWGQIATEPVEKDNLEEVDVSVSYARSFGKFTLTGGLLRYMYPGFEDADSTNELFIVADYDVWLAPSISVYRDLDVESTYVELGVAPEYTVGEKVTLSPGLIAALYSFDEGGNANRIEPSLLLSYPLTDHLSASAQAHYVIGLEDKQESGIQDQLWGGIRLNYEF